MNRTGQAFVVGIMFAFIFFITCVVLIEPIKQGVNIGRDSTHMDCGNQSISTGQQMGCIVVDTFLPAFIGIGFAVALSFLGVKAYRNSQ